MLVLKGIAIAGAVLFAAFAFCVLVCIGVHKTTNYN